MSKTGKFRKCKPAVYELDSKARDIATTLPKGSTIRKVRKPRRKIADLDKRIKELEEMATTKGKYAGTFLENYIGQGLSGIKTDVLGGLTGGIAADVTAAKSAKLYIKNIGTDTSQYFTIGMGKSSGGSSEEGFDQASSSERYCQIGRLYGGDWMLIPWDATATNGYGDITIQPSVATTMTVEYMGFFQ